MKRNGKIKINRIIASVKTFVLSIFNFGAKKRRKRNNTVQTNIFKSFETHLLTVCNMAAETLIPRGYALGYGGKVPCVKTLGCVYGNGTRGWQVLNSHASKKRRKRKVTE